MSPKKKKSKETPDIASLKLKRENESENGPVKRAKTIRRKDEEFQAKKRKNFVTACEQVSYKAYFDHRARLLLIYLPSCMKKSVCKHHDSKNGINIKQLPSYAEETFKIDIRTNTWCEALEVCQLCITPVQYLSANVLKDVVEIMLNAHEDQYANFTISYLIDKCQQILSQNFSTHPPCLTKSLRKCYNDFLTSPLDLKEKTFTDRTQFGYDKGIVKYCMNRLEYEISAESKDEALVDKYENIPEEMQQSVKGLHWQKEKFEIFEVLERPDRIQRLMAVLESIIELLQFDLAIWHSRYTKNQGSHIMRSHKPIMAYILWSNNVLYTGAVNNNCRQILRLFVYLVHLQYPEKHLKIMTIWLNSVIQTFYICETNSNSDYPNVGKYCTTFANEFYKIISEMPQKSLIRILERIQPNYMRYLIGIRHLKKLLSTDEDCVVTIIIDFIKHSRWNTYPQHNSDIQITKDIFYMPRNIKRKLNYLIKKCKTWTSKETMEDLGNVYPKLDTDSLTTCNLEVNRNYIVHTLYITLEAYLDAYSVQNVQETLDSLNEQLLENDDDDTETKINNFIPELSSYFVTEQFIKKYRSIYQMLRELVLILQEVKNNDHLPDIFNIFENIGLLEF